MAQEGKNTRKSIGARIGFIIRVGLKKVLASILPPSRREEAVSASDWMVH
jgi:hypothetical protein